MNVRNFFFLRRFFLGVVSVVVFMLGCQNLRGCGCGRSTEPIAELTSISGHGERSQDLRRWSAVESKQTFLLGDAFRTAAASRARVRLTAGGQLNVGPSATIRFLNHPQARRRPAVRVLSGEAEIESEEEITLQTELGTAVLAPGTRLRIHGSNGTETIDVVVGRVQLESIDGGSRTVNQGDHYVVNVSGAILETLEPNRTHGLLDSFDQDATLVPIDPDGDRTPEAVGDGGLSTTEDGSSLSNGDQDASDQNPGPNESGDGGNDTDPRNPRRNALTIEPSQAEVAFSPGENPTIHNLADTTGIHFAGSAACTTGTTVEISTRTTTQTASSSSPDGVAVLLSPGLYTYSVRCRGRSRVTGRIRIVRDSGNAPMPRRAPRNNISLDGMNYNVSYQNLLPEIQVQWRSASGGPYVLTVRSESGRQQIFRSNSATILLNSGQVAEGRHTLVMASAQDPNRHSAQTGMEIRFDNAAPSAEISEPPGHAILTGPTVHVAGSALAGSSVVVSGTRLALDGQNRFRGDVRIPVGHRALSIRIAHPRRGVQYYLRRIATAP